MPPKGPPGCQGSMTMSLHHRRSYHKPRRQLQQVSPTQPALHWSKSHELVVPTQVLASVLPQVLASVLASGCSWQSFLIQQSPSQDFPSLVAGLGCPAGKPPIPSQAVPSPPLESW